MISDFKGKTAVLTGAASGFGLACARLAAQRGMNLVLVDVETTALAAVQQELAPLVPVMAEVVDVSSAEQMAQLAQRVKARFGAPNWVFNNAGVGSSGLIWENSHADWQWVLGVNLWGVIHGLREFVPMMLDAAKADANYQGHIINTASMAGLLTAPNMGVYNVSKHAVVALSETLYQDLRLVTQQISASVLCPYFVPTGIAHSQRNRPDHLPEAAPTKSQQIGQAMSEKAVGSGKVSADDVAQLVFAALQEDHFYIFSHPQALDNVRQRFEAVLAIDHPPDPFAQRPDVGAKLRDALGLL